MRKVKLVPKMIGVKVRKPVGVSTFSNPVREMLQTKSKEDLLALLEKHAGLTVTATEYEAIKHHNLMFVINQCVSQELCKLSAEERLTAFKECTRRHIEEGAEPVLQEDLEEED